MMAFMFMMSRRLSAVGRISKLAVKKPPREGAGLTDMSNIFHEKKHLRKKGGGRFSPVHGIKYETFSHLKTSELTNY
jgi:hypothetical protein